MTPIEHRHTRNAVCPYCGHEHRDSYEFRDDQEVECYSCEKPFYVSRLVRVTYTTSKLGDDTP